MLNLKTISWMAIFSFAFFIFSTIFVNFEKIGFKGAVGGFVFVALPFLCGYLIGKHE